ncbi:cold-responsive protein kinase 1 isoform X1 [Cucumis sativus]|uniref:cold-responsive protein kinase 1 isoform X1 n=1 Tax=Cucumis sativus TaxID=3659 RepID=UPI0005ECE0E0|nr:cold-responsive protein kinase 1 isoform X1 [Cucumis sativus]XP_031739797.1 cold-responsive protein kinase 1 isoform X1 [Cucumis sativus]
MTCFCFGSKRNSDSSVAQTIAVVEEISNIPNVRLYSYKELRKATENFRSENKLGQGGFGSVYKGRLGNGTLAAIKVLSMDSSQGTREFLAEINVISVINHDNLVKLHGCCVEGQHRILVYPYLENSSLDKMLFGGRGHRNIQFNWQTRCKICIGVAQGLAFLHEEVQPHVIHRDIKASNILLDKDLNPKISDFGLARLLPANLTHVSTRVAGTVGYLAPEFAIRGQATRRTDIYSFGVLLLEIVCGRYNINRRLPAEEPYLLEMVWEHHEKGQLLELVDISLRQDFVTEQACRYLKIGLLCTQDMPKLRPSMATVVKMLTGEIDISDQTISRPGMLSEFMLRKDVLCKKGESTAEDSGKPIDSTSSSRHMDTSYATITFDSIFDRSN